MFAVRYERSCGGAVSWLSRLVAGLSSRRPRFNSSSVDVRFVVDKVALGRGFLRVPLFFPVSIILPILQTHMHLQGAVTRSIATPHAPERNLKYTDFVDTMMSKV
jgi:hypothetical protein